MKHDMLRIPFSSVSQHPTLSCLHYLEQDEEAQHDVFDILKRIQSSQELITELSYTRFYTVHRLSHFQNIFPQNVHYDPFIFVNITVYCYRHTVLGQRSSINPFQPTDAIWNHV